MPKGLSPPELARHAVDLFLGVTGPKPRVVVAFSGGVDSMALAHMLVIRRRQLGGLRLVHVDHGLQSASRDWSRHCARQARAWKVPFTALRASIPRGDGGSLEAAAREARYRLLGENLRAGEILVTAHHLDDQAETLLLQLFRGAGVAGLAAMPGRAKFAQGEIRRPLLLNRREEIERYAVSHGLEWIEDPSNQQDRFRRNFLRNRVMPLLREHWPGIDRAIARSAAHMSEASRLLDTIARADLMAAADGDGLTVSTLRALPSARRRNALRSFISRAGVEPPSAVQLDEIAGPLLAARADAQPQVRWPGASMRRRAGRLELQAMPEEPPAAPAHSVSKSWSWRKDRRLLVNDVGDLLMLVDDAAGPIDLDRLPARLRLRPRRGGESLRPNPRARTQSLKKLLQAAKLTLEERARLPLLFGEGPKGRLIAAGDRWRDASVSATVKSRRRARLVWQRSGKK